MRIYGRIPRTGTSTLGFVGVNATVNGTTFTTTAGYPNAPWAAGVYSTSGYTSVTVSTVMGTTGSGAMLIGLNDSPSAPYGSSSTYALYFHSDSGQYQVFINGIAVATTSFSPVSGDVGTIAYTGSIITFLVNGTVIYTASVTPQLLYITWTSFYVGATSTLTINPAIPPRTPLQWIVVQTAASGDNSMVYVTALAQVLSLRLNESPFYSSSGIPAQQSVSQQVPPDYYVALIQQAYAQYFTSLQITRVTNPVPTYQVNVITNSGAQINASVPVPI